MRHLQGEWFREERVEPLGDTSLLPVPGRGFQPNDDAMQRAARFEPPFSE